MDEDHRLINAVLNGNQHAFRQLVERYQDFVFTITYRVLRSREEAEEAAQDVFLKVYKMLGSFEKKSRFSTWLYTIAYRAAIDSSRKKNRKTTSINDDESFIQLEDTQTKTPLQIAHQGDLKQQISKAIGQLPPKDAALITLFYLKENSVKEIAEITGLSVSNIKTKLHRLREQLKKLLGTYLKAEIQDLL